jgi:hypothetical protein
MTTEHKYSQDFDEQQAKLAPADRVVVTCKMHEHAHDYTKCPVCFQQYCAQYWSACPQCNRDAVTTDDKFVVVRTGGSIGNAAPVNVRFFNNQIDARAFARRRNSQLSKGERGYYGIKYSARKI